MTTTGIVLTTCFIVLGVYDFVVVCRRGVGCSISRCLQGVGFKSPIVSIVIGALLGHFFLYMPPEVGERDILKYLELQAARVVIDDMPSMIPYFDSGFAVFIVPEGMAVRFVETKPGDDN